MSFSTLAWGEEWGEERWDFPVLQFPLLCPDVNKKAYTLTLPFSVIFELLHGMRQEESEMLRSHVLFISLDSIGKNPVCHNAREDRVPLLPD